MTNSEFVSTVAVFFFFACWIIGAAYFLIETIDDIKNKDKK